MSFVIIVVYSHLNVIVILEPVGMCHDLGQDAPVSNALIRGLVTGDRVYRVTSLRLSWILGVVPLLEGNQLRSTGKTIEFAINPQYVIGLHHRLKPPSSWRSKNLPKDRVLRRITRSYS
jgi:hypothetical protein